MADAGVRTRLAGVFVDDEISKGINETVAKYPQFKIVGSVHGDWAQEVAQKAVAGILPSLPEVKAVVTQGGDGYGAAQAFAKFRATVAAEGDPDDAMIAATLGVVLKHQSDQVRAAGELKLN